MKKTSTYPISRREFLLKTTLAAGAFTILPRYVVGGKGFIGPNDKIVLGFIGCGRQTRYLVSVFADLPDIQVIAGCDVDKMKLDWFTGWVNAYYAGKTGQTGYKACDGYGKYEELIARKDIDAVVIATPDHWHAIPALAAMEAGKDIYCEKPMAHTIFEGRAMVKTARKYKRVFQVGSMQRSWNDFRHACELVTNGYIGQVKKVMVNVGDPAIACDLPAEPQPTYLDWDRWLGPAPLRPYNQILSPPIEQTQYPMWRLYREYGGGILSDWGTHMFDIAQWGLGMDKSGPVTYIPPDDRKAVRGLKMIYANGVELTHEDFGRGWAVRFIGTEGTLDVSRDFLDSKPETIARQEIKSSDKRLYFSDNHYTDWTKAIRNRTRPVSDVGTGHRSASICNIANIAYRLGRKLEWDTRKEVFKGDEEANRLRGQEYRRPYIL
jgi:predicted dehydrogenase